MTNADEQTENDRNIEGLLEKYKKMIIEADQIKSAIDEHLLSVIFASDGNEEERWIYDMENACPYCLGSGHKDDVPHVSLLALDEGN